MIEPMIKCNPNPTKKVGFDPAARSQLIAPRQQNMHHTFLPHGDAGGVGKVEELPHHQEAVFPYRCSHTGVTIDIL